MQAYYLAEQGDGFHSTKRLKFQSVAHKNLIKML